MNFSMDIKKGVAEPYVNTVRRLAYSFGESWRPVAIKLNTSFDLITASSTIVEDTFRIISNLTAMAFAPKSHIDNDCVVETYEFTGQLFLGGDIQSSFIITGGSGPIITSLGDDVIRLTVVYRRSSGVHNAEDNRNFLEGIGEDPSEYRALNSRHTDLQRCDFVIEPQYNTDLVKCTIVSSTGNEREILSNVIKVLEGATDLLKKAVPE